MAARVGGNKGKDKERKDKTARGRCGEGRSMRLLSAASV